MEAISLIAERVKACEAAGVEVLCCPEAVLGGLADYSDCPADLAIDVARAAARRADAVGQQDGHDNRWLHRIRSRGPVVQFRGGFFQGRSSEASPQTAKRDLGSVERVVKVARVDSFVTPANLRVAAAARPFGNTMLGPIE